MFEPPVVCHDKSIPYIATTNSVLGIQQGSCIIYDKFINLCPHSYLLHCIQTISSRFLSLSLYIYIISIYNNLSLIRTENLYYTPPKYMKKICYSNKINWIYNLFITGYIKPNKKKTRRKEKEQQQTNIIFIR